MVLFYTVSLLLACFCVIIISADEINTFVGNTHCDNYPIKAVEEEVQSLLASAREYRQQTLKALEEAKIMRSEAVELYEEAVRVLLKAKESSTHELMRLSVDNILIAAEYVRTNWYLLFSILFFTVSYVVCGTTALVLCLSCLLIWVYMNRVSKEKEKKSLLRKTLAKMANTTL